jgi:hypothetical protein
VAASASSAFLASKSVQNGLKGVHLVSVHKSAAKSCIIEKNSSFAKERGPARTHGECTRGAIFSLPIIFPARQTSVMWLFTL